TAASTSAARRSSRSGAGPGGRPTRVGRGVVTGPRLPAGPRRVAETLLSSRGRGIQRLDFIRTGVTQAQGATAREVAADAVEAAYGRRPRPNGRGRRREERRGPTIAT